MKQNLFTGDRDDRRDISMDSDEIDYQGQGFHLTGEESSKASSVLCPYSLPKFDFDEGPLRFDSLVENEVFLGIQSQDDNQWIEDFSRDSSGIDFSSSAPDSCSIPRHNNVWSEATSSESVEMLLKSVGQEDMVLDDSVIRDSNAGNELPSSNQMDTNFMHDSKLGDFKESNCGTPPAQFQEAFSPQNKVEAEYNSSSHRFDQSIDACAGVVESTMTGIIVTEQNLPVDVKGDDENASKGTNLIGEVEPEYITSSDRVDQPIDVCAGGVYDGTITSIVVPEQNLPIDVKGDDESASKDTNLIGESLIDKIQEDNIDISCISSDLIAGSEILCAQNKVLDISSDNLGLPLETNIVGSHGASDTSFVHSTVCVVSDTEVRSENAVKTNTEQLPMLPPQGNPGLPAEQGCESEVCSPEHAKGSTDGCVALTEGTGKEPQSDTKVLCGEKPCTSSKVDDEACSREESSVVFEISNDYGNEHSLTVSNNDQYIICPEPEKESVVPKVMSGGVMDGDDVMVHGVSDSSFMLDDGQAVESPTQKHTSVPAACVAPETESLSENAEKTQSNTEQSPIVPRQDNSTLHTEEGCKSGLFSPDLTVASIGRCVTSTEGMANQQHSESNDLSGETSCAVIKVDDVCCSTKESSMISEIGNVRGNEQSFSASNNDQCFMIPELEKLSVVPKVALDGDDVYSNSSKDVVHVEPMEAESAEGVQQPNDVISSFNVSQERNDGNLTSDLVNKNTETHDNTQSLDHVQPTEALSLPKPSTTWEKVDETLAPESENVNSERDAFFNEGDFTKCVDHLESAEASPLKQVTSISAEQDSHERIPLNVMQKSNDESLSSVAIIPKFETVLPLDDGNKPGLPSSNNITEENVPSTGGGPDSGLHTEGEMGSHDEVRNISSVPAAADALVISIHQEDQVSQTTPSEASISDNNDDKKDAATVEVCMEDIDENMKQCPDATVVTSAPALSAVETEAKDVNQSMNLLEFHGEQTNVEQTEVAQVPCGAESVSPPASSAAETEANNVNLSMNIAELHVGRTNLEPVTAEVGQEPCGTASVPLHSDSVVSERDGADSGDLMNVKGVAKDGLALSGEVSDSMNSVVDQYIDSAPVVSTSEISSNEGKTQSCMTKSKDKDVLTSGEANVVAANLSSTISNEGMKVASEKDSSERAEGTLKEDRTFTFPTGLLPVVSGKETNPVEGSHSSYNTGQMHSKVPQGTSLGSPQIHDQKALSGGTKGTSERKTRRGSGKLAKVNPAKGNCSKEAEPKFERGIGNPLCAVLSPSATVKPMPLEAGSSAQKPTAVVAHSSNLPDLNTSTSTAVLFRQPFTDLQQVQLRAQIFVYGSLIQGVAPDETCMVSAFGTSDGGRSVWEPAWRACMQRLQKSHVSNPETPVQSRSVAKAKDQVTKTGLSQRKSRVSSNGNSSSSAVTPIIPLSSPLWNISTPSSDALPNNTVARSPLHGYQTPANFSGQTRVSQAPFPIPWMASPQVSTYNVNAHIAPPQPTEIVKLTTIKASPAPSPATMHAPPIPVGQNGQSGVVNSSSVLQGTNKLAASYAPQSAETKSRKRKKGSVSQDHAQISFPVAPGQPESVSVSVTPAPSANKRPALGDLGPSSLPPKVQVEYAGSFATNSQFLASATMSIPPGSGLKSSTEKAIAAVSPVSSVDHTARSHAITEERAPSLVEAAKLDALLQAEQSCPRSAVVSPVVDLASSQQISEKRALILDEFEVDAKLQAEQAGAHAAVVTRAVDFPASSSHAKEKRALSLDEVAKVEEAKLHAEQASAHAAAAVSHCQNVWSQLVKQNNSNLMLDSEARLASAAACIAAAASVAKAASAAAKVASTVALQAKLMADEAVITNRSHDSVRNASGLANETGSATSSSILKAGEGGNGSSSIIYAAREAARRRVEAASAASKHAENLDAIVKAAELAAEAVAQAGKIVALGDPLPLSKLVEGGPAGYWKNTGTPFSVGTKQNIVTQNNKLASVEEHPDRSMEQPERPLDSMQQAPVNNVLPDAIEKSKDLTEDQVNEKRATGIHAGELEGLKSSAASKMIKTVDVAPESESGLRLSADENITGFVKDSRISVGSLVEVFKGNGDLTGAWFTASVLSLKSGKAMVSYKDVETDQGGKTEWVPLEAGPRKPPVIRLAHPMTSLMFDGNRKRRRDVAKDYSWSVGDRVDAWLENCWSEGVVVDKNKNDDTTLSVHFPAQGKTIPVKAWHLRPSFIWMDGGWIESLSSKTDTSSQSDTPKEKRMKLGSPTVDDGKLKEKITKIMDPPESRKFEESRLLPLSAKEKSFHIGSTKNDKPETHRTMRSGLPKEGPRVAFGAPKPGKKRKLDVSKHSVSSHNPKADANIDEEKFAKRLVPEGGAYGWKYSSKVDAKEREARTRNFKPTKPPNSFTRTLPQKDKSLIPSISGSKEGFSANNNRTDAASNDDSSDQHPSDFVSSSNIEGDEPISSSSRTPHPRAHRKMTPSNANSDRLMKGRSAAAHVKPPNKVVEKEKSVANSSEPRRSNRRIQPTSRLLEGLQSSLIMSKTPMVSHVKGHKGERFGPPRGMRS